MIGPAKPDKIYFIGIPDGSKIKIGIAVSPEERLAALRSGSPVELILLATGQGSYETERFVHFTFWNHHSHGEWFFAHPDILAAVEHVKRTGFVPSHLIPPAGVKLPRFKPGPGSRTRKSFLEDTPIGHA
jgi:hypothetical protein